MDQPTYTLYVGSGKIRNTTIGDKNKQKHFVTILVLNKNALKIIFQEDSVIKGPHMLKIITVSPEDVNSNACPPSNCVTKYCLKSDGLILNFTSEHQENIDFLAFLEDGKNKTASCSSNLKSCMDMNHNSCMKYSRHNGNWKNDNTVMVTKHVYAKEQPKQIENRSKCTNLTPMTLASSTTPSSASRELNSASGWSLRSVPNIKPSPKHKTIDVPRPLKPSADIVNSEFVKAMSGRDVDDVGVDNSGVCDGSTATTSYAVDMDPEHTPLPVYESPYSDNPYSNPYSNVIGTIDQYLAKCSKSNPEVEDLPLFCSQDKGIYLGSGLRNLGNTCYIASILQVFMSLHGFVDDVLSQFWRNAVKSQLRHDALGNNNFPADTQRKLFHGNEICNEMDARAEIRPQNSHSMILLNATSEMMSLFQRNEQKGSINSNNVSVAHIKNALCRYDNMFAGHSQHDAHEFMTCFLSALQDECEQYLISAHDRHESKDNCSKSVHDNFIDCKPEKRRRSDSEDGVRITNCSSVPPVGSIPANAPCTPPRKSARYGPFASPSTCLQTLSLLSPRIQNNTSVCETMKTTRANCRNSAVSGCHTDTIDTNTGSSSEYSCGKPHLFWCSHEEYKNSVLPQYVPTVRNMQTVVETTFTCTRCQYTSTNQECYRDFSLNVPWIQGENSNRSVCTLSSLMSDFFAEEIREMRCNRCYPEIGYNTQIWVKSKITQLPKYLIIHIKRFQIDPDTQNVKKLTNPLELSLQLDMRNWTTSTDCSTESEKIPRQLIAQDLLSQPQLISRHATGTVSHNLGAGDSDRVSQLVSVAMGADSPIAASVSAAPTPSSVSSGSSRSSNANLDIAILGDSESDFDGMSSENENEYDGLMRQDSEDERYNMIACVDDFESVSSVLQYPEAKCTVDMDLEDATPRKVSNSSWKCPVCTLQNSVYAMTCDACGTFKFNALGNMQKSPGSQCEAIDLSNCSPISGYAFADGIPMKNDEVEGLELHMHWINADRTHGVNPIDSQTSLKEGSKISMDCTGDGGEVPCELPCESINGNLDPNMPLGSETLYELKAVVRHLGATPAYGHYISDIRYKKSNGNIWKRCDDSRVTLVEEEMVLEQDKETPYILVYEHM